MNNPACSHSWHDFGQLSSRNVSWCSKCDALAFTGQEPEPMVAVGSILKGHTVPKTEPWCREILLYSPNNQGDSPQNRVQVYANILPQTR